MCMYTIQTATQDVKLALQCIMHDIHTYSIYEHNITMSLYSCSGMYIDSAYSYQCISWYYNAFALAVAAFGSKHIVSYQPL